MSSTSTSTATAATAPSGSAHPTSSLPLSSSSAAPAAPHRVRAHINYLSRDVKAPYQYLCQVPAGDVKNNFQLEAVEREVLDLHSIPGGEEERRRRGLVIEQAGFELVRGWGDESAEAEAKRGWAQARWDDDGWVRDVYYRDVERLVKRRTGASTTFIFDHTVRKSQTSHLPDDPQNRKPVGQAHVDQTRWAGENRIQRHFGAEALEQVKSGARRARLINVWRPLRGPVWDFPLGVADFRTATWTREPLPGSAGKNHGDFVKSELRYADWTGETLLVHPNPKHQWYYARGMETDEALLLLCYDSKAETKTPHTAFVDPETPADAPPRWSVECRVLALE